MQHIIYYSTSTINREILRCDVADGKSSVCRWRAHNASANSTTHMSQWIIYTNQIKFFTLPSVFLVCFLQRNVTEKCSHFYAIYVWTTSCTSSGDIIAVLIGRIEMQHEHFNNRLELEKSKNRSPKKLTRMAFQMLYRRIVCASIRLERLFFLFYPYLANCAEWTALVSSHNHNYRVKCSIAPECYAFLIVLLIATN